MPVLETAISYVEAGLSVIPVKCDGTKKPALKAWKEFQQHLPSDEELSAWFADESKGIGILAGAISNGLEIIDIENREVASAWQNLVIGAPYGEDLLDRLCVVRSPKGFHCYYRCEKPEPNQDLARRPATEEELAQRPDRKYYKLIETRGEGGYAIAPGSPAAVHPSGEEYRLIQESFTQIPLITMEERELLLECARSLNEYVKEDQYYVEPQSTGEQTGDRPGDLFNQKATWQEILEQHGWKPEQGSSTRWCRPGSSRASGRVTSNGNYFYTWSSSVAELPFEKAVSKYALYAFLNCGGDFKEASRRLASAGYCKPREQKPKAREQKAQKREQEPPSNEQASQECEQQQPTQRIEPEPIKTLMAKEFAPLSWAVQDLLPEGLTIIASAPKTGKSWLSLDIALAVSRGEKVLGGYATTKGEVLYLALEDSERRLQNRLQAIASEERTNDNASLYCLTDIAGMLLGGMAALDQWLTEHPDCRLVIIDTLAKFMPPADRGVNAYHAEYAIVSKLQKLAMKHRVALLGVHHVRKQKSSDVFDETSGSAGMTGPADALWILKRPRTEKMGTLTVTGRDIEESEFSIGFDQETLTWSILGDARQEKKRSQLQALNDAFGQDSFTRNMAELVLGVSTAQAKRIMTSLYQGGYVSRESVGTVGKKTHHYTLTEKIGEYVMLKNKQQDIFSFFGVQ